MQVYNLYIAHYFVHNPNTSMICYKCPEKAVEKACICIEDDNETEYFLDYCKQHKETALEDAALEMTNEPEIDYGGEE